MRSILLILVAALPIVLSESAIAGEIYKWTDANGRVHFGDRPSSANAEKVERATEGTNPIASLKSFDRCQAYMRTPEFKAWPIQKRMDYNAKCMQMYEQNLIDKVETADRKIERERQRKIRQIEADRYAASESKRLNRPQESNSDWNSIEPEGRFGRPSEGDPARWSDESYCQGKYGRSCSDLATWKTKALDSCKRKNPSGGCGAASIQKSKPVTLEEQKARRAARAARNQQKTQDYQDRQQRNRR